MIAPLLPGVTVAAAGVFGVQDHDLAAGLLGQARVANTVSGLVSDATQPLAAVPVVVAVSTGAIHILDWDHEAGARAELARFDRSETQVTTDSYRSSRRLTLLHQTTGYRLALTSTVSRWNGYGPGAQAVIKQLGPHAQ